MHWSSLATRRLVLMFLLALLALSLPQVAFAHDINKGMVGVSLTAYANGANEVALTAEATPGIAAPILRIEWTLVDGGELLDGPAESSWSNVPAQTPMLQSRRLHLPGPGIYEVAATAILPLGSEAQFTDAAILYLIVDQNGTVAFSRKDPQAVNPMGSTLPEVQDASSQPEVTASATTAPNGDPCFSVHGIMQRIERTPTKNGYAADSIVPVRSALVEMREEDTLFDDSYGETITDDQGRYSFSFCDDDGIFDDTLELYVRLHAVIQDNAGHDIAEIQEDGLIPPEDVYEFDSNTWDSDGGDYTRNYTLTEEQSGIMNIGDAILDAWRFWNNNGGAVGDDAIFDYQAEVNWEAGDDDDQSHYNGYVFDEITIADAASDPDQWDDSVIIHEWNHQADDNYGCDDSPGGDHSSDQNLGDPELAWSEGYANYYQSAVRSAFGRTDGNYYIDVRGPGKNSSFFNLETRDTYSATLNTPNNEMAIAAMLWDLEDSANDNQDRTGFGSIPLQQVFTDPVFSENGDIFDDTCTAFVYLWSWVKSGKPTNGDVGAIVQQNIGIRPGFLSAVAAAASGSVSASDSQAINDLPVGGAPEDFKWWKNLTWVVDNSASMADSGKLDAVKTVMKEQVNDLAPAPKGTEFNLYTFNNANPGLQQPVGQKFYADLVNPAIDSLTTIGAADGDCSVNGLSAMTQAAQRQRGGDIWLYTDRASTLSPSIENSRRLLNQQQIRGSFAMLGGCAGVLPTKMSDVTGGEIDYLGKAANGSQSTGIVPYLLTALGSGGQFIYVREDQLGSAADILRAQVANSAGAGKWSDYVSDNFTYRWDRLEAGEYQWFPAESLGQGEGQLPDSGYMVYTLPEAFPFYGSDQSSVGVSQDGFLEFAPCASPCPIIKFFREYLDVLNNDMQWLDDIKPPSLASAADATNSATLQQTDDGVVLVPAQADADESCKYILDGNPNTHYYGPQVCVFSANLGFEWHIISTQGYDQNGRYRAYQIWLNTETGEIRYQYGSLHGEAANAEIGLRERHIDLIGGGGSITTKFLVSNKDAAGAVNGMGYKFVPAPPQPTRTYTVAVDGLMESVGFLQTGYSGRFEPMLVKDPAGNPVNCSDTANVLCITMNNVGDDRMVQYVQVNVNGNTSAGLSASVGEWSATIDAQSGYEGTFTFSALAASSIQASTVGERMLPSLGKVRISTRLGSTVDGNSLSAWLQRPNGERFGTPFALYDDGQHGDGRAGDGIFSLPDLDAPGKGVGYLWIQGAVNGVNFVRNDSIPYNFQPIEVTMLNKQVGYVGGTLSLPVRITNLGNVQQCFAGYADSVTLPEGWGHSWSIPQGDDGSEQLLGVCIASGASIERELLVTPSQAFFDGPSLAHGEVAVTFVERERGSITDSDSATVTRYREANQLVLLNPLGEAAIRPNGVDTATLSLIAYDDSDLPVVDGTPINLTTDRGTLEASGNSGQSITGYTKNGRITITFTADTSAGKATVSGDLGGVTATAFVNIAEAGVHAIHLQASPTDLTGGANSSSLVATVTDVWGNPVPNVSLRIGVSDDSGSQGTIGGAEVITGTSDSNGQLLANFNKADGAIGKVNVRAEYFIDNGSAIHVVDDAEVTLTLSEDGAGTQIYLPLVVR